MFHKFYNEEEEPTAAPPKKRYVAVVGVTLDKYKARFRPGDEIPLEYLEDPEVAFYWLLYERKAIKELEEE